MSAAVSERCGKILPQGSRFLNLNFLPGPVAATLKNDSHPRKFRIARSMAGRSLSASYNLLHNLS